MISNELVGTPERVAGRDGRSEGQEMYALTSLPSSEN